MRNRREIHTVDELIDLLGSPDAAAEAFGVTKPAVHNWRQRGVPLRHYRLVSKVMADLKATATDDLFAGGSPASDSGASGRRAHSGRRGRKVSTGKTGPDFESLAAELRALTAGRRQTPAEQLKRAARSALIARLREQPVVNAGRWTRDELYERGR